jgi:hypothetical protein
MMPRSLASIFQKHTNIVENKWSYAKHNIYFGLVHSKLNRKPLEDEYRWLCKAETDL